MSATYILSRRPLLDRLNLRARRPSHVLPFASVINRSRLLNSAVGPTPLYLMYHSPFLSLAFNMLRVSLLALALSGAALAAQDHLISKRYTSQAGLHKRL